MSFVRRSLADDGHARADAIFAGIATVLALLLVALIAAHGRVA